MDRRFTFLNVAAAMQLRVNRLLSFEDVCEKYGGPVAVWEKIRPHLPAWTLHDGQPIYLESQVDDFLKAFHSRLNSSPATRSERPTLAGTDELSTRDAAAFLSVSVDTLNVHVRDGRLPRRNISPHGSSRGPFLYKVSDLAKLRDGDYRRIVPRGQLKILRARKTAPPVEPDYDDLDL